MKHCRTLFSGILLALLPLAGAQAQGQPPLTRVLADEIPRTAVWMIIAGLLFAIAFKVVDWTTPGDLKKQLAEGNTALAIYAGSLFIACALIIAALVG